jgi:dsDNA-specific endonuclease/ATPase MutS2
MSRHALEVLEFGRVLERIARRAGSDLGRARVLELAPSSDLPALRRELARVGAVMRFMDEKPAWGLPSVPDVRTALAQLAASGAVLEPTELHGLGILLASSRIVAGEIDGRWMPKARFSTRPPRNCGVSAIA